MVRIMTVLLCASLSGTASAQIYKCIDQGKVTYSEAPCPGARVTRLEVQAAPTPDAARPDAERELQRQRTLADKLAAARQAREATDERARASARRVSALRFQKCEKLRLRKKWAAEDAASVRDSAAAGAMHKKAARAAEALKVECPG